MHFYYSKLITLYVELHTNDHAYPLLFFPTVQEAFSLQKYFIGLLFKNIHHLVQSHNLHPLPPDHREGDVRYITHRTMLDTFHAGP